MPRHDFNPRTPVGCDPHSSGNCSDLQYFNPRTPVGCDRHDFRHSHPQIISIHAPQWGATFVSMPQYLRLPNFNPRTPVGCDSRKETDFNMPTQFQSTHPSGVRRIWQLGLGTPIHISIHAPQWGATRSVAGIVGAIRDFNPRTPVGCDATPTVYSSLSGEFQSTHPSGVRHAVGQWHEHGRHFNPRTPVGCDVTARLDLDLPEDFNPRTPVGCDPTSKCTRGSGKSFQSTHPSGVRPHGSVTITAT